MTKQDFVLGIRDTLNFLKRNGIEISFESGNFYIYLNWTNKFLTVHKGKKVPTEKSNANNDYLIRATNNGAWIGPFVNFVEAYCFAVLLKKAVLFKTHEELSIGGVGLIHDPYKFL